MRTNCCPKSRTHWYAILRGDNVAALSDREREVFHRVAAGDMNKVIAMDLGISTRTVEVHRS